MALRKSPRPAAASATEQPQIKEIQEFNTSPEVDKKIDEFIRNNPKQFEYYSNLPKDRLIRGAILKDVQAQERTERTRGAILRKLDADPEMKKSVETMVRNLPEEKKRIAMANLASRTFRMQARSTQQKPSSGGTSITAGT